MDMVKKQVIQYLYCGKSSLEMMEEIGKISKSSKTPRSEEHTSELQSQSNLVCRLLLEKKNHLGARGRGGRRARHGAGKGAAAGDVRLPDAAGVPRDEPAHPHPGSPERNRAGGAR